MFFKFREKKDDFLKDYEMIIMQVIWHSKKTLSETEVWAGVNRYTGKVWEEKIFTNHLNSLLAKNFLMKLIKESVTYYLPVVTENEYAAQQIEELKKLIASGCNSFEIYRPRKYTSDEWRKIQMLIDELE